MHKSSAIRHLTPNDFAVNTLAAIQIQEEVEKIAATGNGFNAHSNNHANHPASFHARKMMKISRKSRRSCVAEMEELHRFFLPRQLRIHPSTPCLSLDLN
jgi:hypothetical protein